MPKTIILCSDGTGNADIKGRGTNVFKLFEAIDLNDHRTNPTFDTQLAFYDDGVGTKGSILFRTLGGIAGYGLRANVKRLYKELSRVYDPGDRIMLFGFSRGAFTVRTLAGMIGACGVLKGAAFQSATGLRDGVTAAYAAYRSRYESPVTREARHLLRRPSRKTALKTFKDTYYHEDAGKSRLHDAVRIAFIGVWDTVDAVGMPFAIANLVNDWIYQYKFPTTTLGEHVDRACQALSIDDPRLAFEPVLWNHDPRIEQVWFAGVHSNVGGGYPKQGMSLVTLDWMLAHAEHAGLRLQHTDRELFRSHATVDDLLYNPRAGFGTFYRWAPRNLAKFCKDHQFPSCAIHLSVAERIAHATDDYAPGNLPPKTTVVFTPSDKNDVNRCTKDRLLRSRAEAIQKALDEALGDTYLFDEVADTISRGVASYWVFMTSWLLVLGAVGCLAIDKLGGGSTWLWFGAAAMICAVVGFVVAWSSAKKADRDLEDRFSQFWQQRQNKLREALKQSKAQARESAEPSQHQLSDVEGLPHK